MTQTFNQMPIYRQRPIYLFIGRESKEHSMTDGMKEMRGQCNCEWIYVLHNFMTKHKKRVLNFVQQVFFLLPTEGSLVITRAYPALYLGGTPSQETGTSPPSCLLLENRLYICGLD